MWGAFQVAGLATHILVLLLGLGAIAGVVPLARGRRAGLGLVLMATAMALVVMEPRWRLGAWGALTYTGAFLAALWLLLWPDRPRMANRHKNLRHD